MVFCLVSRIRGKQTGGIESCDYSAGHFNDFASSFSNGYKSFSNVFTKGADLALCHSCAFEFGGTMQPPCGGSRAHLRELLSTEEEVTTLLQGF